MPIVYRLILPFAMAVALLFVDGGISGQPFNPVPVAGLSTGSVYDLLADRRGFIWVAHETGISRYDGNSFTHFYCDQQTGLAMTDIIEDRQGRIWCHNFNGQLFYIEHEKMYLLEAYNSRKEKTFQRTILLGDELLSTSAEGLFICNTTNLKSVFIPCPMESCFIRSIAVASDKAILTGKEFWFIYQREKGLKKLKVDPALFSLNFNLQPIITKDTVYAIENFNYLFSATKIFIKDDSVIIADRKCYEEKINTITKLKDDLYVNTITRTYLMNGAAVTKELDLSDEVIDRDGNYWFSSLEKGLMCEKKIGKWQKVDLSELQSGDFIRKIKCIDSTLVIGTNNGFVYTKNINNNKVDKKIKLLKGMGSVQDIHLLYSKLMIINPVIGMLLFDPITGRVREMSRTKTYKKVAVSDSVMLLGYPDSLTEVPFTKELSRVLHTNKSIDIDTVIKYYDSSVRSERALRRKRCKYICYDKIKNVVYASFMDGVYVWENGRFNIINYNGKPAHAFSMVESDTKVIISSFDGLFYLNDNNLVPFEEINKLKMGFITSMKVYKQYLFLIEYDKISVVDIQTQGILSIIPLPENYSGLVYDIDVAEEKLYLANPTGLYTLNFELLQSKVDTAPVNYLLSVTANGKDITLQTPTLEYSENNLQFKFAAPGYLFPAHTFFYYQLKGSNDTTWRKMNKASFILSLASLKPGDYTLNAYAVNYRMQKAVRPISFHFVISKPWWQQTWFMLLTVALLMLATYLIVSYRYRIIRRRTREKEQRQQQFETALLQSQIVVQEQERKRIAEDLHDDIGATLSALHLHISNLPEHTLATSPDLQSFYKHSLSLASKAASDVRDISHDLMPKDFSALGLFAVLQNRIDELNASNAVRFIFISDGNEKTLDNIYSVTIYRIVNELISNIIRHAQAQQASIQILITETEMQVIAEDNGIGMQQIQGQRGIGMKNIYSRVDFLKGTMHVDSSEKGTAIIITIPINREVEDAGATPE